MLGFRFSESFFLSEWRRDSRVYSFIYCFYEYIYLYLCVLFLIRFLEFEKLYCFFIIRGFYVYIIENVKGFLRIF